MFTAPSAADTADTVVTQRALLDQAHARIRALERAVEALTKAI
jgi:hypothetical protein